jgi:hypothetical protein
VTAQLRVAAGLYAALWLALLVGAAAGRLVDGSRALPVGTSGGGGLFATVVATNARLIGVLALAALLVARVPAWRWPLDVVVAALLAVNALAVGTVVGAGGRELARSLAHLPLEWAGLAAGATLYAATRRGALSLQVGLRWAIAAVALVVMAAGVEAWAPLVG